MKRRSREEEDASWICEVGSEWMTRRRKTPSAVAVDDDDQEEEEERLGISELGLQWMGSRPSLRKANGSISASEIPKRSQGENSDQGHPWAMRTDLPRPSLKTRAWKDGEGERGGWSSERTCVEEDLDDDSWVADVGYRWVNRQRNSKNHKWKNQCYSHVFHRSELQKSAWVSELGFQWMSSRKERGVLYGRTLLSDPSSLLYMSRKRRQVDDWISQVGADWMSGKKSTRDQCIAVLDHQWDDDDTRRKLQFATPGRGCMGFETGAGFETGEFGHVKGLELFHEPERSGSESLGGQEVDVNGTGSSFGEFKSPAMFSRLGGQEVDVEGLGSSFGEFKRPAMCSPFDSGSNSYC